MVAKTASIVAGGHPYIVRTSYKHTN
jgi:hypothetical protein